MSDVPQPGSAEQGIGYRMGQDVAVGVAEQPQRGSNLHASQQKLAAFHEPVRVVPDAAAKPCLFLSHEKGI